MRCVTITVTIALIAGTFKATSARAQSEPLLEKHVSVGPGVVLRAIETRGSGVGVPLVFIPGWSAGADLWRDQIARFQNTHRVIAFDPRSQGESTKTASGNTPEQRAADLHRLLAAEHVERPVLVGWSQAAQDIAAYVLQFGTQELGGIVFVDAAVSDGAKGITARPQEASASFDRFSIYVASQDEYLRGMFQAIISKPQPAGVLDQAIATAMKTPPSTGIAMLVSDMFGPDRTGALTKIDCPVLIIAAASSGELARQKAEATIIRNARFVAIEDAAHAVFLDQPDRFAAALAEFLATLPAPARR